MSLAEEPGPLPVPARYRGRAGFLPGEGGRKRRLPRPVLPLPGHHRGPRLNSCPRGRSPAERPAAPAAAAGPPRCRTGAAPDMEVAAAALPPGRALPPPPGTPPAGTRSRTDPGRRRSPQPAHPPRDAPPPPPGVSRDRFHGDPVRTAGGGVGPPAPLRLPPCAVGAGRRGPGVPGQRGPGSSAGRRGAVGTHLGPSRRADCGSRRAARPGPRGGAGPERERAGAGRERRRERGEGGRGLRARRGPGRGGGREAAAPGVRHGTERSGSARGELNAHTPRKHTRPPDPAPGHRLPHRGATLAPHRGEEKDGGGGGSGGGRSLHARAAPGARQRAEPDGQRAASAAHAAPLPAVPMSPALESSAPVPDAPLPPAPLPSAPYPPPGAHRRARPWEGGCLRAQRGRPVERTRTRLPSPGGRVAPTPATLPLGDPPGPLPPPARYPAGRAALRGGGRGASPAPCGTSSGTARCGGRKFVTGPRPRHWGPQARRPPHPRPGPAAPLRPAPAYRQLGGPRGSLLLHDPEGRAGLAPPARGAGAARGRTGPAGPGAGGAMPPRCPPSPCGGTALRHGAAPGAARGQGLPGAGSRRAAGWARTGAVLR
ncbi:basic proline-rich protein-like [Onychostruthus taczanowskii]|uniref:basic proline-rich protein-like n=1 Tax=Onychostruthus taczanowskii TaxID=356909 RepID=UPI001B8022ED|nr:basic proline-rich protein-like [Onychostruthus taczanowskii]